MAEESSVNQSLNKALDILNYFDEKNPSRGLSQLAKVSGYPKATVYRILNTFEKNGFLRKVHIDGKANQYELGIRFLELGSIVSENLEIVDVARPFMKELRDNINEDVQMVMREENHVYYVEKFMCSHPVRLFTKKGRKAGFTAGACPRAILSFLDDHEINILLGEEEFIKYTEGTIVEKEKLWHMIRESREVGYTISYGEMEAHTIGIGVPIYDYKENVVGAISIAGPDQRFTKDKLPYLIEKTLNTANSISRALGYRG
ncbi:MAG: IclR family transcriptional regulator [Anaeromicrobium sp.]|uniref:IclR family transcriptional regulator n=1 Tax=Anaeromicrobium sp. TaxID=1929132 RepID=UPI0025FC95E3|nr:IclR family transcriptional regulator [Anaeromicrobium sp.]MCT4594140.1 IclR family transcriptional regulator [Anaeromicrobium sp.]